MSITSPLTEIGNLEAARFQSMLLQTRSILSKKPGYKKTAEMDFDDDFNNFYKATDNISTTNATGTDMSNSLNELRFLTQKRLGVGYNVTDGFARDALFNWFDPADADDRNKKIRIPGFKKWILDTDFKNQAMIWDAHKRKYGIGLLLKFWSTHDKMNEPPPKNTPPRKFQVLDPGYLAPFNTFDTRYMTYDEDVWKFQGGNLKVSSVHRDRIEVIRGDPQPDTYRGLSVVEPIYLPLICYFNLMVYLTRGIAKWGSMVPIIKSASATPTVEEYTQFLALMQEFIMNGFFFLGKDDDLQFPTTNVGDGVFNLMEVFKEDIASGVRIPLNYIFMRSESGGIGDGGALTAERKLLNQYAVEQEDISDDFRRVFTSSGFDFDELQLSWNLSLIKTRQQILQERNLELQNLILEQQLESMKKENHMMKEQIQLFKENKDKFNSNELIEASDKVKEDFDFHKKRFAEYRQLSRQLSFTHARHQAQEALSNGT